MSYIQPEYQRAAQKLESWRTETFLLGLCDALPLTIKAARAYLSRASEMALPVPEIHLLLRGGIVFEWNGCTIYFWNDKAAEIVSSGLRLPADLDFFFAFVGNAPKVEWGKTLATFTLGSLE